MKNFHTKIYSPHYVGVCELIKNFNTTMYSPHYVGVCEFINNFHTTFALVLNNWKPPF